MHDPRASSWQNPRILCTLLLVFVCGAATGALTVRLASNQTARRSGPSWKEAGREITLEHFRKELNLTPEQAQQVGLVLDDFFMYYQTLQAQMDDVRGNGKTRIINILNDDQKRRFEKMMTELQAKQIH